MLLQKIAGRGLFVEKFLPNLAVIISGASLTWSSSPTFCNLFQYRRISNVKRKMSTQSRGAFIVFEGGDRSGKTTQCALLVDALKREGMKVEHFKFPGIGLLYE